MQMDTAGWIGIRIDRPVPDLPARYPCIRLTGGVVKG